jgi:hypothetical protein
LPDLAILSLFSKKLHYKVANSLGMSRNGYKLSKKKSLKPTHKTKIGTTNRWGLTNNKSFGPIVMMDQLETLNNS